MDGWMDGWILGLGIGLGMGFGLGASFLALRYSVLSFAIWSLISFSLRISSSVWGASQGSGMVDLLYSSLLFRLIWVSFDMICDSGGGSGLGLDSLLCLNLKVQRTSMSLKSPLW